MGDLQKKKAQNQIKNNLSAKLAILAVAILYDSSSNSADGLLICEQEWVFISTTPALPVLTSQITSGSVTGSMNWSLIITYNRSFRHDTATYSATLGSGSIWNINSTMGNNLRGGEATLKCYAPSLGCWQLINFRIRAHNEAEGIIVDYINSRPGAKWYYQYVAEHEGGMQDGREYLQFNEVGPYDCDASDMKYTPNATPNENPPGFGIFQLNNFGAAKRLPYAQELWSWKTNVDTGAGYLTSLQNASIDYMARERLQAFGYGSNFLHPPVEVVGGVSFEDGTSIIIDHAVAMKRYNGVGGTGNEEYCEWRGAPENRWAFNRLNDLDPPFNYVEQVCLHYK